MLLAAFYLRDPVLPKIAALPSSIFPSFTSAERIGSLRRFCPMGSKNRSMTLAKRHRPVDNRLRLVTGTGIADWGQPGR